MDDQTKPSLFRSIVKSFLKSFFAMIGIFAALIPFFAIISLVFKDYPTQEIKNNMVLLPDLNGNSSILPISTPAILQINVEGVIGDEGLNAYSFHSQLIDSRKGFLEKDRVKGILLYVNTPGGSVEDSDAIYRLLLFYKEHFKVPVYAYVAGISASGGVYVTSAADKIYASPSSMIGSVGVRSGPFFNFVDAIDKLGIAAKTLTVGKDKDMFNPFRKWKDDEDQSLLNISKYLYQRFVDVVTLGRPKIDKEKLINEYGAQVYSSPKAEEIGFIDYGNSDYRTALLDLLKASNIDEKKPYQVVELKPKKKLISELFKGESPLITGKIKHSLQIGNMPNKPNEIFSYLYEPRQSAQ